MRPLPLPPKSITNKTQGYFSHFNPNTFIRNAVCSVVGGANSITENTLYTLRPKTNLKKKKILRYFYCVWVEVRVFLSFHSCGHCLLTRSTWTGPACWIQSAPTEKKSYALPEARKPNRPSTPTWWYPHSPFSTHAICLHWRGSRSWRPRYEDL